MICNLYLSRFLKRTHKIESKIYEYGLHTIVIFPDIDIRGNLINIKPVSQGNQITLDIDPRDWNELYNYINK